jgi:hypothetical protein
MIAQCGQFPDSPNTRGKYYMFSSFGDVYYGLREVLAFAKIRSNMVYAVVEFMLRLCSQNRRTRIPLCFRTNVSIFISYLRSSDVLKPLWPIRI